MAACSYSIQAATLTSTTDAEGNTLWDVGVPEHTLDPVSVPNLTQVTTSVVKYNAKENGVETTIDGYDNKDTYVDTVLLLDGKDKLGTYKDDGTLRTSFGNWSYTKTTTQVDINGDKKYNINDGDYITDTEEYSGISKDSVITNNLDVTGTLLIKDSAQVVLGGQYKYSTIYNYASGKSTTSKKDDYLGLIADTVIVNGSSDSFTNLKSERATIDNLVIRSGKVEFHTTHHQGSSNVHISNSDNKVAYITNSLYQDGGILVIGKSTKETHDKSDGSPYYVSGIRGTLTQDNGAIYVYGNSDTSNLSITQSDGEIYFRDRMNAGTKFNITQNGKGTIQLGQLFSTSSAGSYEITQNGAGNIMLAYGSNFKKASTISINQSGSGIIDLGGTPVYVENSSRINGFDSTNTTYNIEQTGTGYININSGAKITANDVTVGECSTINVYGGMTVNGTTTIAGTIDVQANASLTLNGIVNVEGKGSILGNMILGNTTVLNFETTANMEISSTLSLTEGNSMNFHIDSVSDEDGFMQMGETGDLNFTAGTLSLNLTDLVKQEMVAGASLEGTEFHLTLIDNLSDADVVELEGIINSSLLLEDYLEELPLTLSRAVAPTVTLESQGLLVENNQLKAVVVATSNNVPEPTTATLGLLALAGLAARRRRK